MKKLLALLALIFLVNACSTLNELIALTKCEFRLHSLQQPAVCGIDISQKNSWSDFSFTEGQAIAVKLLQKSFPFDITVHMEVRNPGTSLAAVNAIQWIAFIDELQVAQGSLQERVEIPSSGGTRIIPLRIHADLFQYLEGDNPRSLLNFALSLLNVGDRESQVSVKIKPSVLIGTRELRYPDYFTLTREFKSGN